LPAAEHRGRVWEPSQGSHQQMTAPSSARFERFLLEMGKGFLFEARQKRFSFDDDHFFVDLGFPKRPNIHARANTSSTCPARKSCKKKLVEWAGKAADARKC